MTKTLTTPYFSFDFHEIGDCLSEQLCEDNNLAREVAQPLFDAGVRTIGLTERIDYHPNPKLGNPPYHFLAMVVQGEMALYVEDGVHILEPGDLACCPLGSRHRLAIQGTPAQWIYFQLWDYPIWEPLKGIKPRVRRYESAALLFLLLRDILTTKGRSGPVSRQRALKNSQAVVNLLRQEVMIAGTKVLKRTENLEKLVSTIRQSPGEDWSRERMATELHISVRQMTRLFNREYGVSPKDFVIRQRMDIASQLLLNTDHKIEVIAHEIGYESVYSFTRLFSRFVGLAPGRYRSRHR